MSSFCRPGGGGRRQSERSRVRRDCWSVRCSRLDLWPMSRDSWAPSFFLGICSPRCGMVEISPLRSGRDGGVAIASVQSPMPGRVYVFQHGSTVLVLRYGLGDNTNRPTAVTEQLLQQIAESVAW